MKKVTVTGGNGFIGQNLVRLLLDHGYHVFCPVRSPEKAAHLHHQNLSIFEEDLLYPQHLTEAIAQSETVFHLAGTIKAARKEDYFAGNLETTRQLLKIINKHAPKSQKLLYLSSQAAAGPCALPPGIPENSNSTQPVSSYGRSKLAAEQLINQQSKRPYVILRPSIVYGPGDKEVFQIFQHARVGIIMKAGFRKFPVNVIYIKDLLLAIMLAAASKEANGKTYFVHDGIPHGWGELCTEVGAVMQKEIFILPVILPLIWMACQAGGLFSRLSRKSTVLNPDKWLEIKEDGWLCDCSAIQNDLHFVPQWNLSNGLKETLSWYHENGWL